MGLPATLFDPLLHRPGEIGGNPLHGLVACGLGIAETHLGIALEEAVHRGKGVHCLSIPDSLRPEPDKVDVGVTVEDPLGGRLVALQIGEDRLEDFFSFWKPPAVQGIDRIVEVAQESAQEGRDGSQFRLHPDGTEIRILRRESSTEFLRHQILQDQNVMQDLPGEIVPREELGPLQKASLRTEAVGLRMPDGAANDGFHPDLTDALARCFACSLTRTLGKRGDPVGDIEAIMRQTVDIERRFRFVIPPQIGLSPVLRETKPEPALIPELSIMLRKFSERLQCRFSGLFPFDVVRRGSRGRDIGDRGDALPDLRPETSDGRIETRGNELEEGIGGIHRFWIDTVNLER